MLQYDTYESPIGTLWLTEEDGMLTGISFSAGCAADIPRAQGKEFAPVKQWLDDYFRSKHRDPAFSMKPKGTAFQYIIWDLLLKIPRGQTRTYGDLAKEAAVILGKEKMSAQAVGQAVGRNPIAIVIPCHRVIGAGGKLTGYAYGTDRKKWLLQHEGKQEEQKCDTQISDILKQNG